MASVHYTDFSRITFERAMDRLARAVSLELLSELRELLDAGQLHDPAKIIAAVRRRSGQECTDAD